MMNIRGAFWRVISFIVGSSSEGTKNLVSRALVVSGSITVLLIILSKLTSNPLVLIDAYSEQIKYRVTHPSIAQIAVTGAQISSRTSLDCGEILGQNFGEAILRPSFGTIVQYRASGRATAITLSSSESSAGKIFLSEPIKECQLPKRLSLKIPLSENNISQTRPFPIAGPAEIGIEYGELASTATQSNDLLYTGNVKIYGRSAISNSLYPISGAEFILPFGGRLTSGDYLDSHHTDLSQWFGAAIVEGAKFNIKVTTDSKNLLLYRLNQEGRPERFKISLFSSILHDPSLSIIILFLALLITLGGFFATLNRQ